MIDIKKKLSATIFFIKVVSVFVSLALVFAWSLYATTVALWPAEESFAQMLLVISSFIIWCTGIAGLGYGINEYFFD